MQARIQGEGREGKEEKREGGREEGRDTSGFARFDFFPCCARDVLRSSHGFSTRAREEKKV